jgi:carboxypeptidase C (cathepsin A)
MSLANRIAQVFAICALTGGCALAALAQDEAPAARSRAPAAAARTDDRPSPAAPRALPADATSEQSLTLPGRMLNFKATAGTIKLTDEKGAPQADIAYVAYQLDGAPAAARPVTFVLNGGPGASSVWLHLGALGPWRLPMIDGAAHPSSGPTLVDNDDTWLDFTDLVFIDPPGTGYSQITSSSEDSRKKLWSVDGDIDALAIVVRRWLAASERLTSPKFIVGESYGGFRAPRLAKALATEQGVGVSGLVLISPVMDFSTPGGVNAPFASAILLPSYAAAARERNGPVTREQLADVEQYAGSDYLLDYLRGPRDAAAVARMAAHVTALTGLDPTLVRQLGGRVDKETFLREFDRAQGKVGANYDATITAYDPAPESSRSRWLDPVLDAAMAPMASAMMDLYAHRLGWKIDNSYESLNARVNRSWDWGGDLHPPESVRPLKEMLALDPNFRVLVTHGLTDLQIPYFGTKLLLDQIPDYGAPGRLTLKVYGGGHMHYMRDETRKMLREDARRLIEGK